MVKERKLSFIYFQRTKLFRMRGFSLGLWDVHRAGARGLRGQILRDMLSLSRGRDYRTIWSATPPSFTRRQSYVAIQKKQADIKKRIERFCWLIFLYRWIKYQVKSWRLLIKECLFLSFSSKSNLRVGPVTKGIVWSLDRFSILQVPWASSSTWLFCERNYY